MSENRLGVAWERSSFVSIHGFRVELVRRFPTVRGRSYSSIHSYLRGGVTPPLEFLEAASDVLGVSLVSLRGGEPKPTTRTVLAREHDSIARELRRLADRIEALPD